MLSFRKAFKSSSLLPFGILGEIWWGFKEEFKGRARECASELISHFLRTLFFVKPVISYLLLFELQAPSRLGVARGVSKVMATYRKFVLPQRVSDTNSIFVVAREK